MELKSYVQLFLFDYNRIASNKYVMKCKTAIQTRRLGATQQELMRCNNRIMSLCHIVIRFDENFDIVNFMFKIRNL